LSENVPVALNCWAVPRAMLGFVGWIVSVTSVAGVIVREVELATLPNMAVIVVVPIATGVALPVLPTALLMVAMDVVDELQVADVVRSWVVLSENIPVALNCWAVPMAILGFVGVIEMETKVFGDTPLPPQPATANISTRRNTLINFINFHSCWNQTRLIGPSPQIPHMPPFFYNNIVCCKVLMLKSKFAYRLLLGG
jgi:hypothetical protein